MKQKAPNPFIFHFRWENEHILLILGDIAAKLQQVDAAGNVRFAAGSSLNAHPNVLYLIIVNPALKVKKQGEIVTFYSHIPHGDFQFSRKRKLMRKNGKICV